MGRPKGEIMDENTVTDSMPVIRDDLGRYLKFTAYTNPFSWATHKREIIFHVGNVGGSSYGAINAENFKLLKQAVAIMDRWFAENE